MLLRPGDAVTDIQKNFIERKTGFYYVRKCFAVENDKALRILLTDVCFTMWKKVKLEIAKENWWDSASGEGDDKYDDEGDDDEPGQAH